MPARRAGLTKNAPPLLRTVGGKEHASDENHEPEIEALNQKPKLQRIAKAEKTYPSPATTTSGNSSQVLPIEIGSDDDPIDEDDIIANTETWTNLLEFQKPKAASIEVVKDEERPTFKSPRAHEIQKEEKTDNPFNDFDENLDDEPDWLASSQPQFKKRKVMSATNLHASAGSSYGGRAAKAYGSASQKSANRQKKDEEKKKLKQKDKPGFRTGKKLEPEGEKSPVGAFRAPQTNILDLIVNAREESPTLGAARPDLDDQDSLSDLDDNNISMIEEGKQYLPSPKPYVSTHKCEHCGEEVEKLLYEEFLDSYNSGKDLNFKWQRRFCTFHNKQKAEGLWNERRYPTIDWSGLERRMRKHDDFLRLILRDEQGSVHRDELKRQLAPGRRSKNIGQMVMNRNVKAGTLVGYYGPRGQKAMVDHIIDNLSDDIRERAVNDDIVIASGAQGGVSGFVQSVLVPHLAEMLIKEDLFLTVDWEAEVREVIAESGELGELMNPETEDEIKEVDDDEL